MKQLILVSLAIFLISAASLIFVVSKTDDLDVASLAAVVQALGIYAGLAFYIFSYLEARRQKEKDQRMADLQLYESTRRSFIEYVERSAEDVSLGLFQYVPQEKRNSEKHVREALAHIYTVLYVEQGLKNAQIVNQDLPKSIFLWRAFSHRTLLLPGFEEFLRRNYAKFSPLVTSLYNESLNEMSKKPLDIENHPLNEGGNLRI